MVNITRTHRIYVEEKLIVRRRKFRRRLCTQTRALLAAPVGKNETWTMDFLHDALATGRKLRTLSIEDAYPREMLAIEVGTSLPALRVVRALEKLRQQCGLPERIVVDHGMEFTSTTHEFTAIPSITIENVVGIILLHKITFLRHTWKLSLVPQRIGDGNGSPRQLPPSYSHCR